MKFTSTLLLAVMLCSALVYVGAQEAELSIREPEVFCYDIELRMDRDIGPVGLQVWDKEKLHMYHLDETDSYIQNADGSITYQFERFRFRKDMPSGEYLARAYGGGQVCEQTFVFANASDRYNMLNRLNEATDDTIGDCILESALILEVDVSDYESLRADWKRCVEDEIMKLDLSVREDESNLDEKITLYRTQLQRVSTIAAICSEQDSDKRLEMIEKSNIGLRLDGYYAELSKNGKQQTVMEYLSKAVFSGEDGIDSERLSREFDGAVLLSVIDAFDWGTIEKAIQYYEETGLISLDRSQFNQLSKSKKTEVYKSLKTAGLKRYTDIAGSFAQICKSYGSDGNSGSGGGGTSSGGSRTVSYAPIQPEPDEKPAAVPEKPKFQDIAGVPWAADSIQRLAEKGVVSGRAAGIFCPNEPVKREEFVKMAALAFGLETESGKAVFEDVSETDWSYPYIAAAVYHGIIVGVNERKFGVGSEITRQDMAVILHRIYQMADREGTDAQNVFLDEEKISDYAKKAVHDLAGENLISGRDDGCFDPMTSVTRAEAAKLIDSVMRKLGGSN